jgi:GGDEF domain-containing protein
MNENKNYPDINRSLLRSGPNLFLRYPVLSKSSLPQFEIFLIKIDKDFQGLLDQKKITNSFEKFFYDPGLNRKIILQDDVLEKIRQVNHKFNSPERGPIQILTRRSLLRVASSEILNNRKVAFINFDLKDLRLVDKVGYADLLLSDFARILKEVAVRHGEISLVPARVGGDEFCIFASSINDIDKHLLEQIYKEVGSEMSKIKAYYQPVGEEAVIEERSAQLNSESAEDDIVLGNSKELKKYILARVLIDGRIPNKNQLLQLSTITNDKFKRVKKASIEKFQLKLEEDQDLLVKRVEGFTNHHHEYQQEGELILSLIKKGKIHLANYLLSLMEDYVKDPLINEPIHTFPDLINHLECRDQRPGEKLIYFYTPWLKILNGDIGYNKTDEIIKNIYQGLTPVLQHQGYDINNLTVGRKRADYIFLAKEYEVGDKLLEVGKFFPQNHLFSEGLPVFITTINYPGKNQDLGQVLADIEKIARSSFTNWLDKQFKTDEKKAKQYIDYYLRERTTDRIIELLDWLSYISKPSEGLINYLKTYAI